MSSLDGLNREVLNENVQTKLTKSDLQLLDEVAAMEGVTRAALVETLHPKGSRRYLAKTTRNPASRV